VISTPDRDVYTDLHHIDNPFHVHELNREEFVDLLRPHFPHVAIWGQMVSAGSLMTPLDQEARSGAEVIAVDGTDDAWTVREEVAPAYLIAVASRRPLPDLPGVSTLIDPDIELVRQAQRQRDAALAAAAEVDEVRGGLSRQAEHIARLDATSPPMMLTTPSSPCAR
jgi:hypothetical protein